MWLYNQTKITSLENIDKKYIGFVYIIENKTTGKKYIGKKRLWKKIRGKYKESDWLSYYGSSKKLLLDKKAGHVMERRILRFCVSLGELSYWETKYQFDNEVLLNPTQWYNEIINCRISRTHIKHMINQE